jgi:transposase
MGKSIRSAPARTTGVDLGDRWSCYCTLDRAGRVVAEGQVATTPAAFQAQWGPPTPRARVVLEVGTHSPWVSRLLQRLGHEALVANPRRVQLISAAPVKHDRRDAHTLADLGRVEPRLLAPIQHRSAETQSALALLRARDAAVRARTLLINHVRGVVKAVGGRLPATSASSFAGRVAPALPPAVAPALTPLLALIAGLTATVRGYDGLVEEWARTTYPVCARLQQVPGVGALTALAFVLTVDEPQRFSSSRTVGAYLGLRRRQHDSGAHTSSQGITKTGCPWLRRLLVQSAHYILGPFGPPTALRQWGLSLAARGGPGGKRRAVVAVARKLAVLLHRLWITGAAYQPARGSAVA